MSNDPVTSGVAPAAPDVTAADICQVTESVPWWTNLQGGLTTEDNRLVGLLVGKSMGRGDLLSERTIVTWVSSKESTTKLPTPWGGRLEGIKETMEKRLQVGVLIARGHTRLGAADISPPAGEKFSLAGYWTVVDVWEVEEETRVDEKKEEEDNEVGSGKYLRKLMVRLEKSVPGMGRGTSKEDPTPSVQPSVSQATCLGCLKPCCDRFLSQRPGCTNPECSLPRVSLPVGKVAVYRPEYLSWRPVLTNLPTPIRQYLPPAIVEQIPDKAAIEKEMKSDKPMWHGYLCQCGKLNKALEPWRRECRGCKKEIKITPPTITLDEIVDHKYLSVNDFSIISGIKIKAPAVELPRIPHHDFVVRRWCLSGSSIVWLMIPKAHVVDNPAGPRKRFQDLLKLSSGEHGVKYSRFQIERSLPKGLHTRWFGLNIGVPYKSNMDSKETNVPFDANLPQVLHDIKNNLNHMVTSVTSKDPNFNEMLSMVYFPNMSMGFHADGEQDVDETTAVASESLGYTATMSFRIDPNLFWGKTASGRVDVDAPVLEGCKAYEERKDFKERYENGLISKADYEKELKRITKPFNHRNNPDVILEFPIPGTGSIMIQQGPDLNRHYQHCVSPADKNDLLRFVNTARTLLDPKVSAERKEKEKAEKIRKTRAEKSKEKTLATATKESDTDQTTDKPKVARKPTTKKTVATKTANTIVKKPLIQESSLKRKRGDDSDGKHDNDSDGSGSVGGDNE